MGRYQVLETVAIADCALDIEGTDVDDLFATAARALAEVMVDPATLTLSVEQDLVLEAPSLDLLLFDWLGELIALKDIEGTVFPRADVRVEPGVSCRLRARLVGGRLDRRHCALRADPKAVTFHLFSLSSHPDGWRARVVIDI